MRTLLGLVIATVLIVVIGYTVGLDRFGDWGLTGLTVSLLFLVSLFDREAFYGPRSDKPA